MNSKLLTLCAIALFALAGCKSDAEDTPAPAAADEPSPSAKDPGEKAPAEKPEPEAAGVANLETKFSDEQKAAAQELIKTIKRGKFPWKEQTKKENADLFLFLAATSEKDEIVAAALHGMSRSWTHWKKNNKKKHVNGDYQSVVRSHLDSEVPKVLGRAIEAAPNAIGVEDPDKEIIKKLTKMVSSHKDGAVRLAAVDAVARSKNFQKDADVVGAMLQGLADTEAHVVSTALFRMQFLAYSIERKDELYAKAKSLLAHKDEGVRGRAAVFAANLAGKEQKDQIASMVFPLLKDDSAFVRSSAAKALATLKRMEAIHAFMGMLDDSTKNSYVIKYTKVTGEPGSVLHDGSAWSRVDESVLYSLKTMTWSMGEKKFKYATINYKTVDKDIAVAIKEAKRWYKKNKKGLPAAPK
jgi:hypothetical protein